MKIQRMMIIMITTTLERAIMRIVTEIFHRDANVATIIKKTFTIVTQGVMADQPIFSDEIKEIMEIHPDRFFKMLEVHVTEPEDDSIIDLGEIFMYPAQKMTTFTNRKVRITEKWITALMRVQ